MNTANYKGYSDWRLPTTVDGPFEWGYDGTTTAGYNITTSEMGYMYYLNLGNLGYIATAGTQPQSGWGLNNTGPFNNLQPDAYWSGTEYSMQVQGSAWHFYFNNGRQGYGHKVSGWSAWAVRDGDVAPVPEPSTMLLLGTGLAGLAAFRKRFKSGVQK